MAREFSDPRLSFYIGDVRDRERVVEAMRGTDIVFHLAALKHVPVGERNIEEFVKTNVGGTASVIEAARINGVELMVFISSDKAVDPINLYGYTKAIGEKLITTANIKSDRTKFICLRAGNVTGTHGSVVPLFREQIKRLNRVTITDPKMTRFLEIAEDIVGFLLRVAADARGGEIFVPKMSAVDIGTLADVMIKSLGNDKTKIEYIGIRPGEKLHEVLISQDELGRIVEYPDYFVVLPYKFLLDQMPDLASYAMSGIKHTNKIYSSEVAPRLSAEELRKKLDYLGYLS
jgi:UDP-N-acetylglucosamine 4,6-dehydratase